MALGLVSHFIVSCTPIFRAILCFLCFLAATIFFVAIVALRWGTSLGKLKGTSDSKSWFGGGVAGAVAGAVAWMSVIVMVLAVHLSRGENATSDGLSPILFCVVFLASSILGLGLGARWKWVGRGFLSLDGGLILATALSVTFRAVTLLPKIVLLAVSVCFAVTVGLLISSPSLHPNTSGRFLCFLSSLVCGWLVATGSDIYAHVGFLDALSLFITPRGVFTSIEIKDKDGVVVHWGSSRFKGLLALMWLVALFGTAVQLYLFRKYGEDPEYVWDSYLPQVASNAEKAGTLVDGRLGTFVPHVSILSQWFGHRRCKKRKSQKQTTWSSPLPRDSFEEGAPDEVSTFSKPPCRYDALDYEDEEDLSDDETTLAPSSLSAYPKGVMGVDEEKDVFLIKNDLSGSATKSMLSENTNHTLFESLASSPSKAQAVSQEETSISRAPTQGWRPLRMHVVQVSAEDQIGHVAPPPYGLPKTGTVKSAIRSLFRDRYNSDEGDSEARDISSWTQLPSAAAASRRPSLTQTQRCAESAGRPEQLQRLGAGQFRTPRLRKADKQSLEVRHSDAGKVRMEVTPSLIHAIQRVSQAQQDARTVAQQQFTHIDEDAGDLARYLGERSPDEVEGPDQRRTKKGQAFEREDWWDKVAKKASE